MNLYDQGCGLVRAPSPWPSPSGREWREAAIYFPEPPGVAENGKQFGGGKCEWREKGRTKRSGARRISFHEAIRLESYSKLAVVGRGAKPQASGRKEFRSTATPSGLFWNEMPTCPTHKTGFPRINASLDLAGDQERKSCGS